MIAMDNKVLLWAKPDKMGILLKGGGQTKTWKKRQFLLKDSYLFYFKVSDSVEPGEPIGVIPLQGCKVSASPVGPKSSVQYIFIVTLLEELARLGIMKSTNYVLAAQGYEDMQSWIDAIRLASLSKQKLQAKVLYARMEVRDLEKRWAVAKGRDSYRQAGRVEALEGLYEGGEGVPSASDIEAILQETLKKLEDLEFQQGGDEGLQDERVIAELGMQMASIYTDYMDILECASESLQSPKS